MKRSKRAISLIMVLFMFILLAFSLSGCEDNTTPKLGDASSGNSKSDGTTKTEVNLLKDNTTVLFMGDSITDGGRVDYEIKTQLGFNHPKLFNDYVKKEMADKNITVYSTGVSGDTLLDQYFRLQEDCYDLKPDVIVMLLGVNDSWNGYPGKEEFEKRYRLLLENIKKNTDAEIILMESFLFEPDEAMQKNCVIPNVGSYIPSVKEMVEVIRKLAKEYQTKIIYLSEIFEQAHAKGTTYAQLASDAIHPTPFASGIMFDQIMLKMGVPDYTPKYGVFDVSEIENQYK